MRSYINKQLFKIARSKFATYFIGFTFKHLTSLMPIRKIKENSTCVSFFHPKKHWEQHMLVVPKRSIPSFQSLDLSLKKDQQLLQSILIMAENIAIIKNLQKYLIVVNGNEYQDVPQLHFHVASDQNSAKSSLFQNSKSRKPSLENKETKSLEYWDSYKVSSKEGFPYHIIFVAHERIQFSHNLKELIELFQEIQNRVESLPFYGFTIWINKSEEEFESNLTVHLTGKLKTL